MSKKRPKPTNSPRRRSPGSTDAMRSMIRLALSLRGPEGAVERRIRSAMDTFGQVTEFDVWLVGTIRHPTKFPSPAPAAFTRLLYGGADAKQVASTRDRWTSHFKINPPALRPVFTVLNQNKPLSAPLVRVWHDARERALLSIWLNPEHPTNPNNHATWISLHRIGAHVARFQLRERRWLTLLHEQCAAVMRPVE